MRSLLRAAVVAALVLVICSPSASAQPTPKLNSCVPDDLRGGAVTLKAEDGFELLGVVLGEGSRGVVLAVGNMGRICDWLPLARTLRDAGYQVLAYESRMIGVPQEGFYRQDRDVVAAAAALRERDVTSIVAVGSDSGGTAVVVAAAKIPELTGLVLVSPLVGFGREGRNPMNGLEGMKSVTVPAFIVASADTPVENVSFADRARELAEASSSSTLQLVPGKALPHELIAQERVSGEIRKFVGERLPESFLDRYRVVVVVGVVVLVLGLVLVAVLLLRRRARKQAEVIPSGGRPDVVDLG